MINISEYQNMLKLLHTIILKQTEGLSNADLLLQPQNGGNCMLWTMAHITDNLREIVKYLGAEVPAEAAMLDEFGYGSDPVKGPAEGLPTKEGLLALYATLQQAALARLDGMSMADFEAQVPMHGSPARRGWAAFFSIFHHAYHVGQLEQLRNLAGRTEKVI